MLKQAFWYADIIERIGFLYGRGVGGRVPPFTLAWMVSQAPKIAYNIRERHIQQDEGKKKSSNHDIRSILWWTPKGYCTPWVEDDWDVWEWAEFRREFLIHAHEICGDRTMQLLLDQSLPIKAPKYIGIYDFPPVYGTRCKYQKENPKRKKKSLGDNLSLSLPFSSNQ